MILIIVLLAIWLALIIIGIAAKALLWLAIVGLVLFAATLGFAVIRGGLT
ncbi:MAG TPA: hypothetical protein VFQ77_10255 [Pseudonocardiaceae bacterium]|jgi:hypothetical protein|nr:hypothetical protein [Pseudonocardiaceae bacterium]